MLQAVLLDGISFEVINSLTLIFWIMMISMSISILIIHRQKKIQEEKRDEMRDYFISILQEVIWFESEDKDATFPMPDEFLSILENEKYRNWFIEDLISTKKNFSGIATKNLENLYDQLELYKTSYKKLTDKKWHRKALGIQELYMMESMRYLPEIFELTRHPNNFVRAEAQAGMIYLKEFEGLVFLDELELPVSEWDQIRLLNHLSNVQYESMTNVGVWLQSPNKSVVMFALKFVGIYHLFIFHPQVELCLYHPDKEIKLQALDVLKSVYGESTDVKIVEAYDNFIQSSLRIKALETLAEIGSTDLLPFLQRELTSENKDIKFAASKAIAKVSKYGIPILEELFSVKPSEENQQIIAHLKFEYQR